MPKKIIPTTAPLHPDNSSNLAPENPSNDNNMAPTPAHASKIKRSADAVRDMVTPKVIKR